jgi:large subunit ribosomal protein L9
MRQNILLIEDVDDLGNSGEIVSVRSGYARNFLLPKKKGIFPGKHTLRMQGKLKEERAKRAIVDKKEAEDLATRLADVTLTAHVKVDPEGKMYGSVSAQDVLSLFPKGEFPIEKKNIQLKKAIKEIGMHEVLLKLKEGVQVTIHLKVVAETEKLAIPPKKIEPTPPS